MAWAGELEGWLTSPPRWHLVTHMGRTGDWEKVLPEDGEQSLQIVPPLPEVELAARTARRVVAADASLNLLPPEFATRYHQQFVDRLWGRGLLAVLALYGVSLMIYFIALGVLNFQTKRVESQVMQISQSYTNALQTKARFSVLKERQELKFAALDCWEAVAEAMPASLTLDSMNFNNGSRLSLAGSANDAGAVLDFSDKLRRAIARTGQPLFNPNRFEPPRTQMNPGGGAVRWSYELELKRTESK